MANAQYLRIEAMGVEFVIDPACAPSIDAAITRYLHEGRDTWLDLQFLSGDGLRLLASHITMAHLISEDGWSADVKSASKVDQIRNAALPEEWEEA